MIEVLKLASLLAAITWRSLLRKVMVVGQQRSKFKVCQTSCSMLIISFLLYVLSVRYTSKSTCGLWRQKQSYILCPTHQTWVSSVCFMSIICTACDPHMHVMSVSHTHHACEHYIDTNCGAYQWVPWGPVPCHMSLLTSGDSLLIQRADITHNRIGKQYKQTWFGRYAAMWNESLHYTL